MSYKSGARFPPPDGEMSRSAGLENHLWAVISLQLKYIHPGSWKGKQKRAWVVLCANEAWWKWVPTVPALELAAQIPLYQKFGRDAKQRCFELQILVYNVYDGLSIWYLQ